MYEEQLPRQKMHIRLFGPMTVTESSLMEDGQIRRL